MKGIKEETPQEKSKRLEESLIRKQQARKTRTAETSTTKNFEAFDVRLKKNHPSPVLGDDWTNVHVTKAEFINIREQLSSTESRALLHPLNIHYWIPTQLSYHPNVYVGFITALIACIAAIIFFSSKKNNNDDDDITPDISSPPSSSRQRFEGFTLSEFYSHANNMRNAFIDSPDRKTANHFIRTVHNILDIHSWNRDEEHLQILAHQLCHIYEKCESKRHALDDERDNLFDLKWFCSLERAQSCLRASNLFDFFEEKLLHQIQKVYDYQLQLRERQFDGEIASFASSHAQIETKDVMEIQTTTMSLMFQEISCQRQLDHLRRQRDDTIRENDRKVRDIDRKLQQCRDRLLNKKDFKKKLKKYKDERRFIMDFINRIIFFTVFLFVTVVFWSLQSTCSLQQGVSSFFQCTFADAVETTCLYISSSDIQVTDIPQSRPSSSSSSLITFAFSPWSYMENLYYSPTETLYSTVVRAPMDVLTVASSLVQFAKIGRGSILPYSDYIYCGTCFAARCFPAYAVQLVFNMIYLSSIGSVLSWLLLIWLFFDVVLKLIHEPLWPLIVLGAVQMLFYIISRFKSNIDFNRSWVLFYLIYMVTMAVFPVLWIYRLQILSIWDNFSSLHTTT